MHTVISFCTHCAFLWTGVNFSCLFETAGIEIEPLGNKKGSFKVQQIPDANGQPVSHPVLTSLKFWCILTLKCKKLPL